MSNFYSAPLSKTQMLNAISEQSGLSRKDVTAVMDSLSSVIEGHLKPGAAGVFKMPGLMKISVVDKPATPPRWGVPNPFRPGETMDVAAKPASRRVKVSAMKNLKAMAG
ncbi:MAG: HU family DNA-binding protein [Arenicellales bacterium]|jgi:nucleoid DNA-binding protein|nr:HU family DNA-binding protein [Arenicellales bacterium]MEC7791071.1 HU family DNA-binding protein [Pseudomonadota bacterium]MEC8889623.1 HU family DNA-binding protein [Pseudomonadota bacterium]MEC9370937.1 HU family DNA-binding protein [Pseudomonadota bacterium]|tara:strand:+ start:31 stop:357 length:327 start_codon:yes stop_codon:yes gene_type:complete